MSRRALARELDLTPPDPTLDLSLRVQVERQMRDRIRQGDWRSGERIPSERTLIQSLEVSRTTLRQAVDTLIHEGMLERIHGSGTYVSTLRFDQHLDTVYSFYDQFQKAGTPLEDAVVAAVEIEAGPTVARALEISPGDLVYFVQRVRSVRGIPLMVNKSYLPASLYPGLLLEKRHASLYALMREHYGIRVDRAEDTLEAVDASPAIAELLRLKPRTSIMLVERRAYSRQSDGNFAAVHYGCNYIRGDMVRFRTRLTSLELVGE
jgi:GntR family transcriptional regulator